MVSVCYLSQDYYLSRYIIENMLKNSGGVELELLVSVKDKRLSDFLSELIKSKKYSNLMFVKFTENQNGYQELIKEAKGKYICLYDDQALVNQNWLMDLVYYNSNIQNSGLSFIHSGIKGKFIPLLSVEDDFINIWEIKEPTGVCLFSESLKLPNEINVKSIYESFLKQGLQNFYIPNQICIKLKTN